MRKTGQRRVVGLLGVGFDHDDTHVRLTQAEQYQVMMGSESTHNELQKVCAKINQLINDSGRAIHDYSPEEFMALVQKLY